MENLLAWGAVGCGSEFFRTHDTLRQDELFWTVLGSILENTKMLSNNCVHLRQLVGGEKMIHAFLHMIQVFGGAWTGSKEILPSIQGIIHSQVLGGAWSGSKFIWPRKPYLAPAPTGFYE
jgi:hypothetical protein